MLVRGSVPSPAVLLRPTPARADGSLLAGRCLFQHCGRSLRRSRLPKHGSARWAE